MTERGGPPARAPRARTLEPPVTRTPAARAFLDRHIGPRPDDVARMLERIGAPSLDALIDQAVPAAIRTGRPLDLPPARSEAEVLAALHAIADRNTVLTSMIGLGYHGTYTPAVIRRNVLENPGWYTSYTPYQPEISQGRLEALLNFQTVIADLTALPIAGASLLDEATAVTEAVLLMRRAVKGREAGVVVVDAECLPQTLAVLRGRADAIGLPLVVADLTGGLPAAADVVGVVVQQPGASGLLRDLRPLIEQAHGRGALVTVAADLLSLALLTPPGELGADVAVGSAQRFGVPLLYGGPHAAYISVRSGLERMLPGRLVGVSVDADGAVAYRLALQTREQHIRREKATSNICTAQALLAVVDGVHRRHHGQQGLGGADVARRLLATDVLLTGLQGESVGHRAVRVDAHADQAAGQHPLQAGPHGDVGGMRAAVEQRDTEPLRGADGDIGAQLTGRRQQGQRQQVRGDRHQGATPVRLLDQRAQVPQHAGRAGLLHDDTNDVVRRVSGQPAGQVRDHEGQADRVGPALQHGEGLRQALGVHDDDAGLAPLHGSPHQQHGFGDRGRLVQQGGTGDRQRRQVGDHGLEVEQRLQPALADLGLVGRVRRVPAGVLQHVAPNHGGRVGAVVPEPDHRGQHCVAVRDGVQGGQHLGLAPGRRQVERPTGPERGRGAGRPARHRGPQHGGDLDDRARVPR